MGRDGRRACVCSVCYKGQCKAIDKTSARRPPGSVSVSVLSCIHRAAILK
jgi:hypothetical protein